MATAEVDSQLASTPRWLLSLTGTFIASVIVWGLAFIAFSAPALHLIPLVNPAATPFVWLSIVGFLIALLSPDFDDDDIDVLTRMIENIQSKSRREKFVYLATLAMLTLGGVSFEVAIIGFAATWITSQFGLGLLAVIICIWYPTVDVWAGRKIGWNIASTGGLLILIVMEFLAILYQVSPKVPRDAANDMRSSFVAN